MSIGRLFFLVVLLPIGCSTTPAFESDGQGELDISDPYWEVVDRGIIRGCRVVDHFRRPTPRNRLCISHVDRHVICESESPSVSSLSWAAAQPRFGECGAVSNPERVFLPMTIVQGWDDTPELLRAVERLLDRLPDEYEEHYLTVEQATALRSAGLSALQSIEYSPSETFGPETLRLLFLVERWDHQFALLMSKRRPLKRYTWGIWLE